MPAALMIRERSPLLFILLSYDILNSVEVLFFIKELESFLFIPLSLAYFIGLKVMFFCILSKTCRFYLLSKIRAPNSVTIYIASRSFMVLISNDTMSLWGMINWRPSAKGFQVLS
jgi:hypothetical protein